MTIYTNGRSDETFQGSTLTSFQPTVVAKGYPPYFYATPDFNGGGTTRRVLEPRIESITDSPGVTITPRSSGWYNFEGGVNGLGIPTGNGFTLSGLDFHNVNGAPIFDVQNEAHGSLCVKFPSGTNSYVGWMLSSPSIGGNNRFYFVASNAAQGNVILFTGYLAGVKQWEVGYSSNNLIINHVGGAGDTTFTTVLANNTPYRVHVKHDNSAQLVVKLFLANSGTVLEQHTAASGTASDIDELRFGNTSGGTDIWMDDLAFKRPTEPPVGVQAFNAEGGTNGANVATTDTFGGNPPNYIFLGSGGTGLIQYDTSQKAHGSCSIKVSTQINAGFGWQDVLETTDPFFRTYFRFDALPAGNITFIKMISSQTLGILFSIVLTPTGTLLIQNSGGVTKATSSTTLSINTWYRLEWSTDYAIEPILRIYTSMDSHTVTEEIQSSDSCAGEVCQFIFGNPAISQSLWFDDLAVNGDSWFGPAIVDPVHSSLNMRQSVKFATGL